MITTPGRRAASPARGRARSTTRRSPLTCVDCHMPLDAVERSGPPCGRHGAQPPVPGGEHGAGARQQGRGADEDHRGLPASPDSSASTSSPCRRSTRRRRADPDGAPRRRRSRSCMTGFAVGEESEQQGPIVIRDVGQVAAPIDKAATGGRPGLHDPRRRRGPDPQDRPLLPRRYRGRVRCLARAAGAATPTDAWSSGAAASKTRGAGRWSRARTSTARCSSTAKGNPINKRNAWQARSVQYVRLIPPGAADVAHYRVEDPEGRPRPDHVHGQTELPQVRALLHAVCLRRRAEAGSGSVARRKGLQQPRVLVRSEEHPEERLRARSRIRSRTCRSWSSRRRPRRFAWVTGRLPRSGSR